MIAATGVEPASPRSVPSRDSMRVVRWTTFFVRSDSMSSAMPSKASPAGVRNESIARARRRSFPVRSCPGRYQPTAEMPCAWSASTRLPMPAGCTTSVFERSFAVSIQTVLTPRAFIRAATTLGDR